MKNLLVSVVCGLVAFAGAAELLAQTNQALVRGTVRDAGGVVPGASIALVNIETGARRAGLTNAAGEYALRDVGPGTYALKVTLAGYKTFENTELQVGTEAVTVDVSLEIASLSEEVIVLGTRRTDRTIGNSPTPVDVFTGEALLEQGATNLNDALRTQVVSLNVQRFVAQDGAAFIRPFSLRGLPSDQTLVLVNGKRRHRSALVQITNQPLSAGAQGPDLATIPAIAVDHVEVLRDGAAAQYGSDAIAGVINFRLKRAREGFTMTARGGQFDSEGDGDDYAVQANAGLPLGADGFFNVSGEYVRSKITSRGAQRPDAQALINAGNTAVPVPAQRWGNPDTEAIRFFYNAEIPASARFRAYSFGNYSRSEGESAFFYRSPVARTDIFRSVPLTSQPGGPRFSFASIFPGGFAPTFATDIDDLGLTGGFTGVLGSGLVYDVSGGGAQSTLDYRISNTVNPSLGPDSPTAFDLGTIKQRETRFNADFVYPWNIGLFATALNVAFGLERRNETFIIKPGEPASYEAGRFSRVTDPDTGATFGLAVGSSGFPGYSPRSAGDFSRSNWAAYVDLETDIVRRLTFGVAARYEDFSDFGGTFNGKASGRFEFSKALAVRASANTGFRAPTPGQSNITEVATNINPLTGGLLLVATLPSTNPIAQFYGASALTPEDSVNWSGGLVAEPLPGYLLTIDYFDIKVEDRIGLTSRISITAADRAALTARGVDAGDFQSVRFLGNFFDSRTRGVDVVVAKKWSLPGASKLGLTAAGNYTRNKVTNVKDSRAVDRERRIEISDFNPRGRGSLSLDYEGGPWRGLAVGSYYGRWTDAVPNATPTAVSFDQTFPAKWLVDLELGYRFARQVTLSAGAENVFNVFPDEDQRPSQINNGIVYPQFSPFGFNGRFLYVRATARF